jgi:hypothetical protein
MRLNHGIVSAAVALLLTSLGPVNLYAEVRLTGSKDNIVLHANNATMPEILTEMQSVLLVRITLIGSTTRQFTGVYVGPLRQVLSRLLDGTNYIVSSRPDGMIVTIIGPSTPRSGPVVAAAPTATDAAAPTIKIAANDRNDGHGSANTGGQGWVPTEDPYKAFRPAAPKPVAPGATIDQAQPARAEVEEPENNGSAQGWTPTEDPYKAFRSAATAAPPAAKPPPRIPDFSALGSVNALMNDMEDNVAPQGSNNGRTDLPNRQLRSPKVPASLAPMLTPPPGLDN